MGMHMRPIVYFNMCPCVHWEQRCLPELRRGKQKLGSLRKNYRARPCPKTKVAKYMLGIFYTIKELYIGPYVHWRSLKYFKSFFWSDSGGTHL